MGYNSVRDAIETMKSEQAMIFHLRNNHYPPLPMSLVPVALRAVKFAKRGMWEHMLRLPKPITYKDKHMAPVSACVEAWHLDAFLE